MAFRKVAFRVGLSGQPVSSRSVRWRAELFRSILFLLTDFRYLGCLIRDLRPFGPQQDAACNDRRYENGKP